MTSNVAIRAAAIAFARRRLRASSDTVGFMADTVRGFVLRDMRIRAGASLTLGLHFRKDRNNLLQCEKDRAKADEHGCGPRVRCPFCALGRWSRLPPQGYSCSKAPHRCAGPFAHMVWLAIIPPSAIVAARP